MDQRGRDQNRLRSKFHPSLLQASASAYARGNLQGHPRGRSGGRGVARRHTRRQFVMSARDGLLASVANTIQDYRAGEIAKPSPEHVDRWIQQFEKGVQLRLLREL